MEQDHTVITGQTEDGDPDFRGEVARIGRLLRSARGDRFSLEALAKASGVSAGLLSQIERGIGNPSFQTLGRVARALGLTMTDLFAGGQTGDDAPAGLVRAEARRRMVWPKEQLSWDVLTPPGLPEITVLRGVLPPGFRDTVFFKNAHYEGWLFRVVLSGSVLAAIDETTVVLNVGDSLTCHSRQSHWVRNETDEPAIVLSVMCPGAM
jgi:transcriptional regulator with XRE-family HTH domain